MPSGARKRKAAAKKKQGKFPPTLSSSSTTSSTQGDEYLKHHESDGDRNTDGDEGVEKAAEDVKNGDVQVEKAAGQDDGVVVVEGGQKPDNGFDQKKGDSSSSRSSSSSDSDDEDSREVEKKVMIVENAPVIDLVEPEHPVPELHAEVTHTTPVTKLDDPVEECVNEVAGENISVPNEKVLVESGTSADSAISPDKVELGQPIESDILPEVAKELAPEESEIGDNVEAQLSSPIESDILPEVAKVLAPEDQKESEVVENVEVQLSSPIESDILPEVVKDLAPEDQKESEVLENAPVIDLVEAEHQMSELPVKVAHATSMTKLDEPVAECESEVVGENVSVLDDNVLVEPGTSADSSGSPDLVELGQKENVEVKLSSPVESAKLPEVTKELAAESQKAEENASLLEVAKDLSLEDKKNGSTDASSTSEADVPKNEEKLILSYNAPRVETSVDAQDVKESEVTGSVDSQACVTSTVQSNQATSWKSCCGLFDAFAGTSR